MGWGAPSAGVTVGPMQTARLPRPPAFQPARLQEGRDRKGRGGAGGGERRSLRCQPCRVRAEKFKGEPHGCDTISAPLPPSPSQPPHFSLSPSQTPTLTDVQWCRPQSGCGWWYSEDTTLGNHRAKYAVTRRQKVSFKWFCSALFHILNRLLATSSAPRCGVGLPASASPCGSSPALPRPGPRTGPALASPKGYALCGTLCHKRCLAYQGPCS